MIKRTVVVTGVGVATPLGVGMGRTWRRLLDGDTGLCADENYCSLGQPFRISGQIPDFAPEKYVASRKSLKVMNRSTVLALAAAREALDSAGLTPGDAREQEGAVVLGTGFPLTCIDDLLPAFRASCEEGRFSAARFSGSAWRLISPLWPLRELVNMPGCHLSIELGWRGPNWTLGHFDASGAQAIAQAFHLVAEGGAEIALCGGADSRVSGNDALLFDLAGLLTHRGDPGDAVCPFDQGADGFAPAEAAAILVLESLDRARARDAPLRCTISGVTSIGERAALSDTESRRRCLTEALSSVLPEGRRTPVLLHTSGLAIPFLDAVESSTVRCLSARRGLDICLTATTGQLGYTGAAAGAVGLALLVQAMETGVAPPIAGLRRPSDTGCDFVRGKPRRIPSGYAVELCHALDGDHVAIALEPPPS